MALLLTPGQWGDAPQMVEALTGSGFPGRSDSALAPSVSLLEVATGRVTG